MSQDDIDRLIGEHSLIRQAFDDDQIAGFWSKAVASRQDALVSEISSRR